MYRPKHFACHLRQLSHLQKICRRYGSPSRVPDNLLMRIRQKFRFLLHKLVTHVTPGQWLSAASCIFAFLQTAGTPVKAQHFIDPVLNPFQISGLYAHWNHAVVDLDDDGDIDILSIGYAEGTYELEAIYLENIPVNGIPSFAQPEAVSFDISSLGADYFFYDVGDLDDDGDVDILALVSYAEIAYYTYEPIIAFIENTGSPAAPAFSPGSVHVLSSAELVRGLGFPHLADIDGDGDLDLFFDMAMYDYDIRLMYYENTGSPDQFTFAQGVLEPFDYEFPPDGQYVIHDFGDLDGDGDLDILALNYAYDDSTEVGQANFLFYQNEGDSQNPQFGAPEIDPFNLPDDLIIGEPFVPVLADWDQDGDLDLSGTFYDYQLDGALVYFENIGTSGINADPAQKIKINLYPNPVHEWVHIALDLPEMTSAEIEISQIHGPGVYAARLEGNALSLDCRDWIPGPYIVRVIADDFSASRIFQLLQ